MRKRIAALAAIALGAGLLSAAPANATDATQVVKVASSAIQTVSDVGGPNGNDYEATFTVTTLKTAIGTALDKFATCELTFTSNGADDATDVWSVSSSDGLLDNAPVDTDTKVVYTYAMDGTNVLAGSYYTDDIVVALDDDTLAGTYTATVKCGSLSDSYTVVVTALTGQTDAYITQLKKPVAGAGASTKFEFGVGAFSTAAKTRVSVSGAGASWSKTDMANEDTEIEASEPFINYVYTDGSDEAAAYVKNPYSGSVTISFAKASGTGYSSTPYMTYTFTVPGSVAQPTDVAAATNTTVAALQAQVTSLTSTVTSIQTSIAALVASTTATLTTLSGQIAKIMKKLKIK